MKHIILPISTICLLSLNLVAYAVELDTDKKKLSYALGVFLSKNLLRQGLEVEPVAFVTAVKDVLNEGELQMNQEQIEKIITKFQQQETQERTMSADQNKTEGEKFLAANKDKEGVKALENGMQYKIIQAGDGAKPKPEDSVKVHYRGTLIDGTEFDSSYSRNTPAEFPINGVIKGWQEILPLMPAGSKWQVVIPSDLAYGVGGAGKLIGPNSTLIFEIELLDIK